MTLCVNCDTKHDMASFFSAHPTRVRKGFWQSTQYLTYSLTFPTEMMSICVLQQLFVSKWRRVGPSRPWNVSCYALACGPQLHIVGCAKKIAKWYIISLEVSDRWFECEIVDVTETTTDYQSANCFQHSLLLLRRQRNSCISQRFLLIHRALWWWPIVRSISVSHTERILFFER